MTAETQTPIIDTERGHIDPAAAFVPVQTRSERPRSYDPADYDAPTGREVNWKHTPIAELATVFIDEETESGDDIGIEYSVIGEGTEWVESTGHEASVRGEFFVPEDLPSAIAWKRCANALHQRIPADVELEAPVHIKVHGKDGRHANAHLIIEAMPNSKGTIILEHSGSAQYAQNVEIIVRDGASLTLVSVQEWDDDAVHVAAHQARVDRDASLRHIVISLGGRIVRVNPSLELAGAGSEGEMFGLAFADDGQYLESQVYLYHKGENTTGDVLYKGALQGKTARTTWIGDVLIGAHATGTDSYEANRNLLLTDGARAESIPNLEIETGDIKGAGHASATGRFDDEQLFYLQARGIAEEEARRLVVLGFLTEVIQKVGDDTLEEHLTAAVEAELAGGVAR